jgi:cytochrome b561
MYMMHKSVGLLALLLLVLRVVWRLADKAPEPEPAPKMQLLAASLVHWGLYALLLAMPVTGYLAHSFRGFPLPWFGVQSLPVPSLTANDPDLAHDFGELHEALVWVLLGLLALHIGAALFHHFVKKDRVLARMTPFIK